MHRSSYGDHHWLSSRGDQARHGGSEGSLVSPKWGTQVWFGPIALEQGSAWLGMQTNFHWDPGECCEYCLGSAPGTGLEVQQGQLAEQVCRMLHEPPDATSIQQLHLSFPTHLPSPKSSALFNLAWRSPPPPSSPASPGPVRLIMLSVQEKEQQPGPEVLADPGGREACAVPGRWLDKSSEQPVRHTATASLLFTNAVAGSGFRSLCGKARSTSVQRVSPHQGGEKESEMLPKELRAKMHVLWMANAG